MASGRLVLFVDEAQQLTLVELGWFADLFNGLWKDRLRLVLFLVGSYHLQQWKTELKGKKHAHVRSRFFTKEYRLRGLSSLEDYQRCLRRYDVDRSAVPVNQSITQYYQPQWFLEGGRLEAHARVFRSAFLEVFNKPKSVTIPMAYFALVVRAVIDRRKMNLDLKAVRDIVVRSGLLENYEPE